MVIKRKETEKMEDIYYTVLKIDGDYAVLLQKGTENTILVARALLPEEIEENVNLKLEFETYTYTII